MTDASLNPLGLPSLDGSGAGVATNEAAHTLAQLVAQRPPPDAQPATHAAYADALDAGGQFLRALLHLRTVCGTPQADAALWRQLGFLLLRLERLEPARDAFARAAELAPDDLVAWEALASAEEALKRTEQATQCWGELLARSPEDPVALCGLWRLAQEALDWPRAEALEPRLLGALVRAPERASRVPRYSLLGAPEHWPLEVFRQLPTHPVRALVGGAQTRAPRRPGRMRIGYQSAHFREHATAILAVGLFEAHDPRRVETFGFNLGPPVDDAYRRRCRAAFAHWYDVFGQSDTAIALQMAAADLDVLMDLDADNVGGRSGIAAHRPARVQLHFLGHPGSTSVEGLDYFLGDALTLPPSASAEFRETLLRLPRCYQPNDPQRLRPAARSRSEAGLPPEGLALCNFNQPWKWRREVFALWVDVLRRRPQACLTLADPGPQAAARVLAHAQAQGLDHAATRIRFAPHLPPAKHLARLAAYDLALDQWPYGAHTTTADALWMAVPTLTRLGPRFAARVAASVLGSVGESRWVAADAHDYHAQLLALADDPAPIEAFKARWRAQRARPPLDDMQGYARDFEDLLLALLATHRVMVIRQPAARR